MNEIAVKKGERMSELINSSGSDARLYRVAAGARLDVVYLGVPGKSVGQYSFEIDEDATVNFYGFILGRDDSVFALNGGSRCLSRRGRVNFDLRSALFDRSRVNFVGDMVIEAEGHESECYLSHKTLLLSKSARTKTIPGLEIKANDVKAGHAATLGQIDSVDLFYLKSRGISNDDATKIILRGFFDSLLMKIEDKEVREETSSHLFKYL